MACGNTDSLNKQALFSSSKSDWQTPKNFFKQLDNEFHFTLDAAADDKNALCDDYLGPGSPIAEDALTVSWSQNELGDTVAWCNPPYGRAIGKWVEKGWTEAAMHGVTVVMLLPARTDTRWFHDYCVMGEMRFIKGRLKFGGAEAGAPFPSMVVVFRPPPKPNALYTWVELR